ncbi:hypothetical protein ACOME3_005318 [Neoechinorhynchus agilis]
MKVAIFLLFVVFLCFCENITVKSKNKDATVESSGQIEIADMESKGKWFSEDDISKADLELLQKDDKIPKKIVNGKFFFWGFVPFFPWGFLYPFYYPCFRPWIPCCF